MYCFKLCLLGCVNFDWVGDGVCDDLTNYIGCSYDGGDCCGLCIDTTKCTKCECLQDEGTYSIFTAKHSWIGNGFCDDSINKVECNFDAGDCCGPNVRTEDCHECQCLYNGTLFGKERFSYCQG